MNPHLGLFVCLTACPVLSPFASAQEWTQFRGPGGQGIGKAAGLAAALTKEHELWRVEIGRGHSSPVAWGDKLFVTRMGKESGAREVVCLDAKTGKEVWATKCEFESHRQHKFNSFASSTPAVDGDLVYVVWSSGSKLFAVAFDHEGKRKWRRELGSFRAQHGSGASPVLVGDRMIVANENEGEESFLIALDRQTGKPAWKIPRETYRKRGAYSCPVLLQPKVGASFLLFASTAHGLTAVDPAAGEVLWETDLELTQRCVNTPCVVGDLVFFSGGSGGGGKESAVVRLPEKRDGKPEIVRRMRRAIPYVPSAIALGGRLYLFNDGGVARCVDAKSGEEVWRKRLEGSFFGSPVSNGETIWIVSRDGVLFSIAKGEECKLLATHELGDGAFATPAIAHDSLYVRTFDHLVRFGSAAAPAAAGKLRKN